MTGHILVTLLALASLCWLLWRLTKASETQLAVSWFPLAAAAFVLLPQSFGEFIPISHFVPPAATDNVLWIGIIYGGLWLLTGRFLWLYKTTRHRTDFFIYGVLWGIMGFWYVLGLTLSQYEPGRKTPHAGDAGIYMAHWGTVLVAELCLFLLLFRSSAHSRSWKRMTVSLGLLGVCLVEVYESFF